MSVQKPGQETIEDDDEDYSPEASKARFRAEYPDEDPTEFDASIDDMVVTQLPYNPAGDKKEVQKFFGKKFNDDAIKLYRNLATPIYVVPVWSHKMASLDYRMTIDEDALSLTQYGVSPERAQELEAAREGGATIIVAKAAELSKGNLPTPWMIVHAMFDSIEGMPLLHDIYSEIYDDGTLQDIVEADDEHTENLRKSLTMGSARGGHLRYSTDGDFIAEIMTQAILTTKGFVYKPSGDEIVDDQLERISSIVKDIRPAFEAAIAGKVINLEVNLLN